jgi:type IX secretion system PorP/SprF family membrane protein
MYQNILQYRTFKIATYLFSFLLLSSSVNAQQIEEFSILRENAVALNPAMVGIKGFLAGEATFRKQFTQLNGAPYTAFLMMEGQVADKNVGIAGSLIQDQVGPTGKTGLSLSASYHLKLGKKYKYSATENGHYNTEADHMITFGLSFSLMQFRLNGSELVPNQQGDPQLYTSNAYKLTPDVAFGVYYQWMNHLYAGVSVPQLMGLNVNYTGRDGVSAIKTVQHLNFLLGGKIEIVKHKFSIDPIAGFRWVDHAPYQGDIGARLTFLDGIWVGGTYRSASTFVIDAGIEIKGIVRLCYAYDYHFASYSMDIGPTHEATLAFKFNRKSVKNTKFFSGLNK